MDASGKFYNICRDARLVGCGGYYSNRWFPDDGGEACRKVDKSEKCYRSNPDEFYVCRPDEAVSGRRVVRAGIFHKSTFLEFCPPDVRIKFEDLSELHNISPKVRRGRQRSEFSTREGSEMFQGNPRDFRELFERETVLFDKRAQEILEMQSMDVIFSHMVEIVAEKYQIAKNSHSTLTFITIFCMLIPAY